MHVSTGTDENNMAVSHGLQVDNNKKFWCANAQQDDSEYVLSF